MKTETAVGLLMLVAASIFFYMSFHIGAWRFDHNNYSAYTLYFRDIAGLSRKSDVKIAGVKVGFVHEICLEPTTQRVRVSVIIHRDYPLHTDATALVRQEGMLGGKYIEITAGSVDAPVLSPGGTLEPQLHATVSLDQLMYQFKDIAEQVAEITTTCKTMLQSSNTEYLHQSIEHFNQAAQRVLEVADAMHHVLQAKRSDIESIIDTSKKCADTIHLLTEQAAQPLRDVVCKINNGEGTVGKLINDDALYQDIRVTMGGVRNFVQQVEDLAIVYDTWCEPLQGLGNRMGIRDSKGYFNVRIFPSEDHFYLIGYVGVTSGKISRYQSYREWFNDHCHPLLPGDMELTPADQLKYAFQKDWQVRHFNAGLWNVQYGKIYNNIAFRFGIFDSTAGVALDINVPLYSDKFRWVTTFEAFDFRGRNRFGDDRPHLKWLNRLFFTPHIYATFGADDFISRRTKNAFVGCGLRFADDDVKYLASRVSILL